MTQAGGQCRTKKSLCLKINFTSFTRNLDPFPSWLNPDIRPKEPLNKSKQYEIFKYLLTVAWESIVVRLRKKGRAAFSQRVAYSLRKQHNKPDQKKFSQLHQLTISLLTFGLKSSTNLLKMALQHLKTKQGVPAMIKQHFFPVYPS